MYKFILNDLSLAVVDLACLFSGLYVRESIERENF